MKALFTAVVSLAVAGSVVAANSLEPRKVADWTGWTSTVKSSGNGFRITSKGYMQISSGKQIPIDLKKKYQISMEYRLAPGAKSSANFYFAPICYDKNGKQINAASQYAIAGTDTVLAAPAAKGAKVVKIKNGAKWQVTWGHVAFDTKPGYADFPNTSLIYIDNIKKNGDVWDVTLKAPLPKAYPAGTAVRNHRSGAGQRYVLYTAPKAEWQKVSRVFTGAKHETQPGSAAAWRIGTSKAGIIIFTLNKPVDMEVRNIKIVELP